MKQCQADSSCVAVELPHLQLLSYVDLDTLRPMDTTTTMVKAFCVSSEATIDSNNAWEKLNTCCPK